LGRQGLGDWRLYGAVLLSALAFLAITPYALLDWPTFWEDLRFEAQHYAAGHVGMEGQALRWYLGYLWRAEGPLIILALAEMGRAALRRDRPLLLIGGFCLLYLVFVSRFAVRNPWTIMPIVPALLVLAASWLAHAYRWLRARLDSLQRPLACVASGLMMALLAWPAAGTIREARVLAAPGARVTASRWIADNVATGSRLVIESYGAYADPSAYVVRGVARMIDQSLSAYIEEDWAYLIFGEGMYGRFFQDPERYAAEVAAYETLFQQCEHVRTFADEGFGVRIYRLAGGNDASEQGAP
jgi:hypothetical protein